MPIESIIRLEVEAAAGWWVLAQWGEKFDRRNVAALPLYVVLGPDETLLGVKAGDWTSSAFVEFLREALAKQGKSS